MSESTDRPIPIEFEETDVRLLRTLLEEQDPLELVRLLGATPADIIDFGRALGLSFADDAIVDLLMAAIEVTAAPIHRATTHVASRRPPRFPSQHRVEVADYIEFGRVVADWAIDPTARPNSVEEMRGQLDGIARIPERFKDVKFVQSAEEIMIINLPSFNFIKSYFHNSEDYELLDAQTLPGFYSDAVEGRLNPLDTLLARVGDLAAYA